MPQHQVWDHSISDRLQQKPVLCRHGIYEGCVTPVHNHIGIELLFNKSGNGLLHIDGKPHHYCGPAIVLLEGISPHGVVLEGLYEHWNLWLDLNSVGSFFNTTDNIEPLYQLRLQPTARIIPVTGQDISRLNNFYIDIATELENNHMYYEKMLILLLQELSYFFIRLAHDTSIIGVNHEACQPRIGPELVDHVLHHIQENLHTELSAQSIAQTFHFSESYIYRLVRQHTGESLGTYLKQKRIQKARNLLEHTDLPIARVGEAVGISHPVVFSRTFRAVTATSPSDYRLNHSQ